jgi:DNA-directed RNA polymerase subunit RPC12/RpoP
MNCISCGKELHPKAIACPKCGMATCLWPRNTVNNPLFIEVDCIRVFLVVGCLILILILINHSYNEQTEKLQKSSKETIEFYENLQRSQ